MITYYFILSANFGDVRLLVRHDSAIRDSFGTRFREGAVDIQTQPTPLSGNDRASCCWFAFVPMSYRQPDPEAL